jgi:hypothetical protein
LGSLSAAFQLQGSLVDKDQKGKIPLAKLASVTAHVRYPLGLADFEYALLNEDGTLQPDQTKVRLILSSQEARDVSEHLIKIALALENMGGAKQ